MRYISGMSIVGPRVMRAPDNDGTGGGGAQNTASTASSSSSDGNNSSDFDLHGANIWAQGNNNPTVTTDVLNDGTNDPATMSRFDQHVQSLDFKPTFSPEVVQQLQQGNLSGLADMMNSMARQVYAQAIKDSSKMSTAAAQRAVLAATEKSTGAFKTDQAIRTLESMVPIAKNPNVAPIAQAVMAQALKAKPGDYEGGAKKVQQFFDAIRNQKSSQFGLEEPPRSGNGQRGGSSSQQFDDDAIDWLGFANT